MNEKMDKNGTKIDLIDINYRRAAVNIAQNIINRFEDVVSREDLTKYLDSAIYDYTELKKNYERERKL